MTDFYRLDVHCSFYDMIRASEATQDVVNSIIGWMLRPPFKKVSKIFRAKVMPKVALCRTMADMSTSV